MSDVYDKITNVKSINGFKAVRLTRENVKEVMEWLYDSLRHDNIPEYCPADECITFYDGEGAEYYAVLGDIIIGDFRELPFFEVMREDRFREVYREDV
jgi:hypothetical protein